MIFFYILPALCHFKSSFELKPHEIAIFTLCVGKRDSELALPCCRSSVFTLKNKIPRAVSCGSKVFVLHVADLCSILHPTCDPHLNMTSLKCLALPAGNPLRRETSSASFHGGQCSQPHFSPSEHLCNLVRQHAEKRRKTSILAWLFALFVAWRKLIHFSEPSFYYSGRNLNEPRDSLDLPIL